MSDEEDGRLSDELNRMLKRLGSDTVRSIGGVFGDWAAIVGEQVAANVAPLRIEEGRLVVEVEDVAWATQVRFLEDDLLKRVSAATSARITGLDVRVKRR